MKLLFVTRNKYKLAEALGLLNNKVEIYGLEDIGFLEEIPEPYDSLKENALYKATFVYKATKLDCFSDDSGLEIDALNGRPGVSSSHYAGFSCSFEDNIKKVLTELKGIKNRMATFRTIIALIIDNKEYFFEGEIRGEILEECRGSGGFGYDPIFKPLGFNETFAQMPLAKKNSISHRAIAFKKMLNFLEQNNFLSNK